MSWFTLHRGLVAAALAALSMPACDLAPIPDNPHGPDEARPREDNAPPADDDPIPAGDDPAEDGERPRVSVPHPVVDTGQTSCYDARGIVACPEAGDSFFGQDAQFAGLQAAYEDNGDGTVSDLNTGLTWQQAHNAERVSFYAAETHCDEMDLGGHDDWRLPHIKELYSLLDSRGAAGERFYIADVFGLEVDWDYEDNQPTHHPEMMGQTWSSTIYTGLHWDRPGVEAAFFFNFFDGRIKQAPTSDNFALFHRCVRGDRYGLADCAPNGDGTVSDAATGLMWQESDDNEGRDWPDALAYCEGLELAGHDDWRLPNVKELQSIVDYSVADPALDTSIFIQTDSDGWFWSSTTLGDAVSQATYICFGKCVSVDGVDTHGAGAQRSDPKVGDPDNFGPMGGQADATRIYNYARCVRGGADIDAGAGKAPGEADDNEGGPGADEGRDAPPGDGERGPGGAEGREPPAEAVEACAGGGEGDACEIETPDGQTIDGVCRSLGDLLACVPADRQAPPDGEGPPEDGERPPREQPPEDEGPPEGEAPDDRGPPEGEGPGDEGPREGGPPEAAIAACDGEAESAECTIETPRGDLAGICQNLGDIVACVPVDGPREGEGDGPGERPEPPADEDEPRERPEPPADEDEPRERPEAPEGEEPPAREGNGPPPEAIAACEGAASNADCTVDTPHGELAGTCQDLGDVVACVPADGPPPAEGDAPDERPEPPADAEDPDDERPAPPEGEEPPARNGDGPPAEAIAACDGLADGTACDIETPRGQLAGNCRTIDDQLACVPARR